jgi:hypothetical protein
MTRLVLRRWFPLAAVACAMALLVYVTVQQTIRRGADQPQVQLAEDAARAFESGGDTSFLPHTRVALEGSLAPFVNRYDADGAPLSGNGLLRSALLAPPRGVFAASRADGESRVTLMPEPGVRIAAVIRPIRGGLGGFVVAGRSLREIEHQTRYVLLASTNLLVATLIGSLVLVVLTEVTLGTPAPPAANA